MERVLTEQDREKREWFIALREEMNLKRPELANEIGMSTRMVYYYETGERAIPRHVERIMTLLKRARDAEKPRRRAKKAEVVVS